MPKLTTEKIAEIREALRMMSLASNDIAYNLSGPDIFKLVVIDEQVARIDKLLPDVNFEGVK